MIRILLMSIWWQIWCWQIWCWCSSYDFVCML